MPEYQSSRTWFASGPTTASDLHLAEVERQQAGRVLEQHDRLPRDLAGERARLGLAPRARDRPWRRSPRRARARAGRAGRGGSRRGTGPAAPGRSRPRSTRPRFTASVTGSLCRSRKWLIPALRQAAAADAQVGERLVRRHQQAQPAAVGAEDPVEAPLLDHDLAQHRVHVGGGAVDGVVGGHHGARAALADRHLEGLRVVLAPQPLVEVRRRALAAVLVAVGEEVLQQRRRLPVARVVALQAAREGGRERADVEGVLAVHLLGAAPARVAREVGVGRAHDDPGAVVLRALEEVARLLRLLRRHAPDELGIPGGAEAVGLGELRRRRRVAAAPVARPALRDAVVALDVRRARARPAAAPPRAPPGSRSSPRASCAR